MEVANPRTVLLNTNVTNTNGVGANSVATVIDQIQLSGPGTSTPATATI